MTTTEKTQMWAMFAAHAAAGFLASYNEEALPKPKECVIYTVDVADNLMQFAIDREQQFIEELKTNNPENDAAAQNIEKYEAEFLAKNKKDVV